MSKKYRVTNSYRREHMICKCSFIRNYHSHYRLEKQMTVGCLRDICINVYCKNNPNFILAGKTVEEFKQLQDRLWIEFKEEKKHFFADICCHTDYMQGISQTLQADNLEKVKKLDFLVEYVQSPYALSLSFLKDPSIIGKNDEFGQLKYNLNMDESLVS